MNDSVDLLYLKKDTKKLTSTEAQISTISGKGMAKGTRFFAIFYKIRLNQQSH